MIAAIIIIGVALYWMLRETDYMRIRLPVGAEPMVVSDTPYTILDINTLINANPVTFVETEMPEVPGTLEILCRRV